MSITIKSKRLIISFNQIFKIKFGESKILGMIYRQLYKVLAHIYYY